MADRDRKAYTEGDGLSRAYKRVMPNKGAPGTDGMSAEAEPPRLGERRDGLLEGIRDGKYKRYLKRRRKVIYYYLLASGKINARLAGAEGQAGELFLRIVKELA